MNSELSAALQKSIISSILALFPWTYAYKQFDTSLNISEAKEVHTITACMYVYKGTRPPPPHPLQIASHQIIRHIILMTALLHEGIKRRLDLGNACYHIATKRNITI
jgi:hypothetical protein